VSPTELVDRPPPALVGAVLILRPSHHRGDVARVLGIEVAPRRLPLHALGLIQRGERSFYARIHGGSIAPATRTQMLSKTGKLTDFDAARSAPSALSRHHPRS
jgi:hypothetical protein